MPRVSLCPFPGGLLACLWQAQASPGPERPPLAAYGSGWASSPSALRPLLSARAIAILALQRSSRAFLWFAKQARTAR